MSNQHGTESINVGMYDQFIKKVIRCQFRINMEMKKMKNLIYELNKQDILYIAKSYKLYINF